MSHKISHRIYGEGPPILLLHGYGGSVHHWGPLVEQLKSQYQLIVPNLTHLYLGHDQVYFSVQAMALAKWIDALGHLSSIHVVGTSYGAALGLALSCFNPEKVKSLSLINPMITHPVSQFSLPELRYFFVSKMKRKDLEFQLSTPIGQAFIIQAASLFRSEEVPERYHLVGRKKEFFTHFVYKLSWILNNEDWDLWDERLKNQTSPKLMIHDRADRLFSTEAYHAFSKKLQNCQLNETLDGGHLSLLSKPVELAQQIQEFLQRIASGKFKKTAA